MSIDFSDTCSGKSHPTRAYDTDIRDPWFAGYRRPVETLERELSVKVKISRPSIVAAYVLGQTEPTIIEDFGSSGGASGVAYEATLNWLKVTQRSGRIRLHNESIAWRDTRLGNEFSN